MTYYWRLLLLFSFGISSYCCAQMDEREFTHYRVKNGLSNNSVTCITQDRFGYIWIGTEFGLNRFDGTTMLCYYMNSDRRSLPSDEILGLHWVDSNILAISTRLGLNLFNISTMEQQNLVVPFEGLRDVSRANKLRGVLSDNSGNLFVITKTGFYHFDKKNKLVFRYDDYKMEEFERDAGGFGVFFSWLDGETILVTGQKGFYNYHIGTKTFRPVGNEENEFLLNATIKRVGLKKCTIREVGKARFIVFLNQRDTAIYIDERKKLLHYNRLPTEMAENEIDWRSKIFSINGSEMLLSAKYSGIFRLYLDTLSGRLTWDTNKLFANEKCNAFFIDRHKKAWIGFENGLKAELTKQADLKLVNIPLENGLNAPLARVLQVVADKNYVYATTTIKGSVFVFDKSDLSLKQNISPVFPPGREKSIYCIKGMDNESIIFGSIGGLHVWDGKKKRIAKLEMPGWDEKHHWVGNIFEDKGKTLWVLTNRSNGCYVLNAGKNKFEWLPFGEVTAGKIGMVWRMAEDSNNDLWMAGQGLAKFDRGEMKFVDYIDSFPAIRHHAKGVSALAADGKGRLWLGNLNNGLVVFHPGTGYFASYTMESGLPDNTVTALRIAGNFLWIACKTGLAKLNLNTLEILTLFNNHDLDYRSISGNELFYDSTAQKMYVGIDEGLLCFSTLESQVDSTRPSLIVENIKTKNGGIIWHPVGVFRTDWQDKNITLSFNAIKYEDAGSQRYAYRMANGKVDDWINLDREHQIVFNNLSFGLHTIELKVYSVSNRWQTQYSSISIYVSRPFWKTWWFNALCLIAVAAISYGLYRYRVNEIRRIATVRSKISEDLHDEVGATLSGISMYSYLAQQQVRNRQLEESVNSLDIIQQSAAEMVNKLNEIVWLINPAKDSVRKLMERLEEYASSMAMVKHMHVEILLPEDLEEKNLPVAHRRQIFLFCKESINNAVKYSGGSSLKLIVKKHKGTLEFVIQDNGGGFDINTVKHGNGLSNMRKRAGEIGGKLNIRSVLGEGTIVSMLVKIT